MRLIPLFLCMSALAGCTVGPNFERPAAPSTQTYLPPAEQAATAPGQPTVSVGEGPRQGWWRAFGSPDLDRLVDQALTHNRSLAASDATLSASRAEMRAVAGRALPQVDATARVDQQQVNLAAFGFAPSPSLGLAGNPNFELYSVGGGISYDLDLFGGTRRQIEQAAAQSEAQRRRTEAAHLTLAGQVVGQVLGIAAIRARIAVQQSILDEDRRNLDLTRKRHEGGEGTLVEVLNAQSQFTADQAISPGLDQQLAEARHLLAILVGVTPADLGPTDFDLAALTLPTDVPVTLPSELVHKRPDILQSEAELHAATAAIGVATAKLYPDITLGATLTQASPSIDNAFKNAFRGYDIFAGLAAPIFHGGTLKAERAAAIERAHAADATYQQTVLSAFGQVADLLSALQTNARAVERQSEAEAVARRSLQLSRRSFEVGNSGLLQVLDSERLYQRASADLVTARSIQLLNVARLYVATAGGWITPSPNLARR
ncbi:efflux transporter outer membrane subunit [Sphingomonas sp. AP4-R1]|uniref:efflux transporter outer membrane subunit n=1 Tax=Sphingomonas sp. AP4-R1 TaxID=2735134 RepID=UPI001493CE6E|nr:efflux transporter outer membrane subunit [Sphingomonas sp. AP4-R1]QJU60092.1 efflux transporter outer membrane subunit [Sphingomonas sp. AP4-R1]